VDVIQSHGRAFELEASATFRVTKQGDIAPGYDADIAIVDPRESFVVRAAESESEQATRRSKASNSMVG